MFVADTFFQMDESVWHKAQKSPDILDSQGSVARWRSWLRHCATRRKVAGSIPDYVTGIFH
jgi:hypothetical protein